MRVEGAEHARPRRLSNRAHGCAAHGTRESAGYLRSRRRVAHRGLRSTFGFRLRAAQPDSRQGQGAEPDLGILVRTLRRHHPQSRDQHRRRRVSGATARAGGSTRRTLDPGAQAGDAPRGVCGARLPRRFRLEGIPAIRNGLRHSVARGARGVVMLAAADLHAVDQGRVRPRREHPVLRGRAPGRSRARRAVARRHVGALRPRGRVCRRARDHHRRVRGTANRRSTSSSSGTTWSRSGGTSNRRFRPCRTKSSPRPASATSSAFAS